MKKVISLVSARPQFIKETVVGREARRRRAWHHVLVHSGQHYNAAVTDSGGYQKEPYFAKKRPVVIMSGTGWRELSEIGWNHLCSLIAKQIAQTITTVLETVHRPENLFGEGQAGEETISNMLGTSYHD